ncbi:TIGR03773 family transporter-associated surface protein [Micromonospora musae]|uniref:TIGR03773 family transporter-associated surface protein n=1 Tax=Micromonospora musae TaxID=1894970 RepID=UPI0034024DE1
MRAGAASLAAAVLALTPAATPAAAEPASATAAGADLVSVALDGDSMSLRFRDAVQVSSGATGRDPADVVLGPDGGLAGRVPSGPAFAFLGRPGHAVWSLSAGDTGFPALDTTGVRPGAVIGDQVTLTLRSIEGPGRFSAYTLSAPGAVTPLFGSGPGAKRSVRLPAGTRTGGLVWTFDAAGDYQLTLSGSAALRTGETVRTEATYRVHVPAIEPAEQSLPAPLKPAARASAQAFAAPKTAAAPKPTAAPKLAAAPKAASTTAAGRQVISDGHVDMGPQLSGDSWTIRIKDDRSSPPVWRETADVVLQVKDKAKITVPAGVDFLGRPGEPVWVLPQTQQAGLVWPGWNTQHESVVSGVKGNVTWTLKGVDGPGRFTLFLTDSFGGEDVLFNSAKPFPQKLAIPLNTHTHGNWTFSKPGLYRLAVQMSGTTTGGKAVTDTKTLTIAVGDSTDPNPGFGPHSGGSGDDRPDQGGGGALPRTGAGWVLTAGAIGMLLVLVGVLLLLVSRRRRGNLGDARP